MWKKDTAEVLTVPVSTDVTVGGSVGIDFVNEPAFSDPWKVRRLLHKSASLNYVLEKQCPGVVERWLAIPPVETPEGFVSVSSKDLVAYTYFMLTDDIVEFVNLLARYENTMFVNLMSSLVLTYASDPDIRTRMLEGVRTPNLLWNALVEDARLARTSDEWQFSGHHDIETYDDFGRIRLTTKDPDFTLYVLDSDIVFLTSSESLLFDRHRKTKAWLNNSPWINYIQNFTPIP